MIVPGHRKPYRVEACFLYRINHLLGRFRIPPAGFRGKLIPWIGAIMCLQCIPQNSSHLIFFTNSIASDAGISFGSIDTSGITIPDSFSLKHSPLSLYLQFVPLFHPSRSCCLLFRICYRLFCICWPALLQKLHSAHSLRFHRHSEEGLPSIPLKVISICLIFIAVSSFHISRNDR